MTVTQGAGLEHKFCRVETDTLVSDGLVIEGYASLFGTTDQGGDIVQKGAYEKSLKALATTGRRVKMLWQHDPREPIGTWDAVREDARGLYVKGRLLEGVGRAREAAALIEAGAIDGLSIGYRTVRASKTGAGARLLTELDLWEISLVTFPMLPSARVGTKTEDLEITGAGLQELATIFRSARQDLART